MIETHLLTFFQFSRWFPFAAQRLRAASLRRPFLLLGAWLLLAGSSWAATPDDFEQNQQLHAPIGDVTHYFLRRRPVVVGTLNQGYQRPGNDAALNFRGGGTTTKMSGFLWLRVTAWANFPWFFSKANYDSTATEGTFAIGTGLDGRRIDWLINASSTDRKQISFNPPGNIRLNFVDNSEFCLGFTFNGSGGPTDDSKMQMWASTPSEYAMFPLICATAGQSTAGLPTLWRAGTGNFRVGQHLQTKTPTPYSGLDGSFCNLLLVDNVTWTIAEMDRLRNNGMPLWIGPAAVSGGIVTQDVSVLTHSVGWQYAGITPVLGATYLLTAQKDPSQNGYWTYQTGRNRNPDGYSEFVRPTWFSNWHKCKSHLGHGTTTKDPQHFDFYAITGPSVGTLCTSALKKGCTPLTCTKINQSVGPTAYSAWAFDEATGDAIDYGSNKLNMSRMTGANVPTTDINVLGFEDQSPLALKFYAGAPRRQNGTNISGDRRAEIAYEPRWLPDGGGPGVGGLTGNPRDAAGFVCAQDAWCDSKYMSAHMTFKLLTDLPGETYVLYAADDASQHVFTGAEHATDPAHNPVDLGMARIGQVDNQWILWGFTSSYQGAQPKHNHATSWRFDCSDIYGPLTGTGDKYYNGDRLNAYEDIIPACKANGFVTTLWDLYYSTLYPGNTPIVTGKSYVCTWANVNDDLGNTTTPGTHRHWINGAQQRVYVNAQGQTPLGIGRGALTNLPTRNLIGISVPKAILLRGVTVFRDLTEDQIKSVDQNLVSNKDQ